MPRLPWFVLALALPVGLYAGPTDPVPGKDRTDRLEDKVRGILTAKSPDGTGNEPGAAAGYRALFRAAGPRGLPALQDYPNDGIALQAAWEQIRLTERENGPAGQSKLDPVRRAWFAGFAEARTRVPVPYWWELAARGEIWRWSGRDSPYHKAGLGDIRAPRDTTLKRDDKRGLVLRVGTEAVPIQAELVDPSGDRRMDANLSAAVTPAWCYVAVHEKVGYRYRLSCLDRATGKVRWASDVWSHAWGGFASGVPTAYVAVTVEGGRVVVFGASYTGFHVEVFRASDGKNLFRFSTGYAIGD